MDAEAGGDGLPGPELPSEGTGPMSPSAGPDDDGFKHDPNRQADIDAAAERETWRQSPELARITRTRRLIFGLTPLIGAGAVLIAFFYLGPQTNRPLLIPGYGITAAVLWIYLGAFYVALYRRRLRGEFQDRQLLSRANVALKEAEEKVREGTSTEFIALWDATQKRLDYYHRIATTQSEKSFLYGQLAAAAGFLVIVVAALVAGLSRSMTSSIVAGLTGVAGGGLGAYIGATFMRSQDVASAQLRAYFLQPLEFSKYLAAERLAQQIPVPERTTAIQRIVESITNTTSSTRGDDNST